MMLALVQMVFALSACSDSDSNEEEGGGGTGSHITPTLVKMEVSSQTANSVSFNIITTDADECAWMQLSDGQEIPTADRVLREGSKVKSIKDTAKVVIDDLYAATKYTFVAVAKSSTGDLSEVKSLEVTTSEADFKGIQFTQTVAATYMEANGLGNYTLALALGELDENDLPATTSSMMMQIDLFATVDADAKNATLPDGTYKAGKNEAFTFNPSYTYTILRTAEATAENDGLTMSPLTSGEITVKRNGDVYTIDIDGTLLSGEAIKARFEGPLAFTYTASSQYEKFTTEQNITLEHEQGRYWGNFFYPHCDDFALTFYSGTLDENGNLADGYYLYIPAFMPKLADYNVTNPPLATGTYDVRPNKSPLINWVPFEIQQGSKMNVFESETIVGAYLMRIDAATGKRYLGIIDSGTMKVTTSENGYNIDFNFLTPEGTKLHASYNGTVVMTNYNDNDINQNNIPRPWSQLDGDVNLHFNASAEAYVFFLGEDIKQGYNSWRIDIVSDPYKDDYLTLEVLTPATDGYELKEREYEVSDKLGAYQLIPGFQTYGGGEVAYCWYGDMNSLDAEGYCTKLAPIYGGTMKLKKNDTNNYTFDFNFVDDAKHAIKGSWTGKTTFYDATKTSAKRRARGLAHQRKVRPSKLLKLRR